jgi:hypothetical protein
MRVRQHGGAGLQDPQRARQPVLPQRAHPQGALRVGRGAAQGGRHDAAGVRRRGLAEAVAVQVWGSHGQDERRRGQDRCQRRDQEGVRPRQHTPLLRLISRQRWRMRLEA